MEGHVLHGLQQQRVEVEHAELAVADPRLALADALERPHVDEHRPRPLELHVVGRGVLQHEVVLERREQQVELDQRRVLQHREGPLVRVRDERDALVAQDRGGLVDEQALAGGAPTSGAVPEQLGRHHARVVEQAGRLHGLEVAQAVRREGSKDLVAVVEDSALGVTKRAGLEAGRLGARVRGRGHGAGHSRGCAAPCGREGRLELLAAAGRLDRGGFRLVLLDAQEPEDAVPVQLGGNGNRREATREDLQRSCSRCRDPGKRGRWSSCSELHAAGVERVAG